MYIRLITQKKKTIPSSIPSSLARSWSYNKVDDLSIFPALPDETELFQVHYRIDYFGRYVVLARFPFLGRQNTFSCYGKASNKVRTWYICYKHSSGHSSPHSPELVYTGTKTSVNAEECDGKPWKIFKNARVHLVLVFLSDFCHGFVWPQEMNDAELAASSERAMLLKASSSTWWRTLWARSGERIVRPVASKLSAVAGRLVMKLQWGGLHGTVPKKGRHHFITDRWQHWEKEKEREGEGRSAWKVEKEATSHSLEMSSRESVREKNKRRALEKKYADMMAAVNFGEVCMTRWRVPRPGLSQYILVAGQRMQANKGTLFFSGGRREMSFVKVPIRSALSHLYPIDSMTLGRSVERVEQFLRCTPPTMKRREKREQGETQPKGKKSSAMKNRWQ